MSSVAIPIACAPFALTAAERVRSREVREQLGALVERVEERPSGFTYHYRRGTPVLPLLAEWIPLERLCCPFLTFEVEWKAGAEHSTLTLSGPEGVKAFLNAEMPELPGA